MSIYNDFLIIVVTLENKKHRLNHIKTQLQQKGIKNYELFYNISNDVFGITTNKEVNIQSLQSKTNPKGKITNGYVCNYLSRMMLFNELTRRNIKQKYIMVLEDDCIFSTDFTKILESALNELPFGWDVLISGGLIVQPVKNISKYLIKPHYSVWSHCVIYNNNNYTINTIASYMRNNFKSTMDHALGTDLYYENKKLNVYHINSNKHTIQNNKFDSDGRKN